MYTMLLQSICVHFATGSAGSERFVHRASVPAKSIKLNVGGRGGGLSIKAILHQKCANPDIRYVSEVVWSTLVSYVCNSNSAT